MQALMPQVTGVVVGVSPTRFDLCHAPYIGKSWLMSQVERKHSGRGCQVVDCGVAPPTQECGGCHESSVVLVWFQKF